MSVLQQHRRISAPVTLSVTSTNKPNVVIILKKLKLLYRQSYDQTFRTNFGLGQQLPVFTSGSYVGNPGLILLKDKYMTNMIN